jgi:hypothetical protein
MIIRLGLSSLLLLSLCSPISAQAVQQSDVNALLNLYDNIASPDQRQKIVDAVSNTEQGMVITNVYLQAFRHEAPLYCAPTNLALTGEQLIDILRREVETNQRLYKGKSWSLVLIFALQKIFPCH